MNLKTGKIYLMTPDWYDTLYRVDSVGVLDCECTLFASKNPTIVAGKSHIETKGYKMKISDFIAHVDKKISKKELPLYANWPYTSEYFTKEYKRKITCLK